MKLQEFLFELEKLAKGNNLSTPYIVGGYVRNKALGLPLGEVSDIDITTGDSNSTPLALAVSERWPDVYFKSYNDGHTSIQFKNIKVDFLNNFVLPEIDDILSKKGIDNPTDLQKEMFSRDFTVNCLLQPMDLTKDYIDVVGSGREDIMAKRLATPVEPNYTIGHDSRRILRALVLSLRYNFEISEELKEILKKYSYRVSDISFSTIKKQINKMLEMDSKMAIELLSEYKLLPIIPISKKLSIELAKNHMVQYIFDGEI